MRSTRKIFLLVLFFPPLLYKHARASSFPSSCHRLCYAKAPFVFPIIGGRKIEHLLANLEALDISLSDEHVKFLESLIPFDPGFPANLIVCLPLCSNAPDSLTCGRAMEQATM